MAIKTDMKGIKKRGNSYTFTVSCGFDGNGKHIRHYMTYKPPEGVSGERADRMAQREYEIFFNKCHNIENESGSMFFKDLCTMYFNEYAQFELKRTTTDQYMKTIEKHILPVFGNKRLKNIKKRDIQSFLCNQPKLKGSTCRKMKIIMSSVFSFAVEEGFIDTNPCVNAKYKKDTYDLTKFKYLTKEESIKLLDITKEYTQLNIILRILLLTGMRIGELLALHYARDIDYNHNIIRINSTLSYANGEWFADTTKTQASTRVIKVNSAIIDMIKEEIRHREERKALCGDAWVETGFLFARLDGRNLDRSKVNREFKKLLKANDLPPVHLHCLRHTFATLLIYLGNDTKAVSSALGHSQTQITNDTYIHIFEEHNARISDSLCNDLLNTATE